MTDKAGRQYPKPEHESLKQIVLAKYGEKYLDCKAFPHLHPWGNGGWYIIDVVCLFKHIQRCIFVVFCI